LIACVLGGVKAQLVEQSGDNARLKIRERELQEEVPISFLSIGAF